VIPVIQPSGFLTTDEFRRLDRATNANSAPHHLEGAFQA
jgi:hypothetical protein